MSEATTDQPSLEIVHQTGTHTSGGSISPNFVENGSALMDSSEFALTADLHPAVSWDSTSGNGVQVQFSLYDSFRGNEEAWYFNSDDNNTLFTIGALWDNVCSTNKPIFKWKYNELSNESN